MKKEDRTYEINLNRLTMDERFRYPQSFEEYKQAVIDMLWIKDIFFFEDDILREKAEDNTIKGFLEGKPLTMEFLNKHHPQKWVETGSYRKRNKEDDYVKTWYDLSEYFYLTPDLPNYDVFFCYQLRNTELLEIDDFLNYTLNKYYESDITKFSRFIQLALRRCAPKILEPQYVQTVNEWIAKAEKQPDLSEAALKGIKTKGIIKRERDDNLTRLNQEQTALLIYCLQNTKIILKDEFLNNKEAGQAFSVLTGYSAETLRQNLKKSEMARIATLKNIDAVSTALKDIQKFIRDEIKPER